MSECHDEDSPVKDDIQTDNNDDTVAENNCCEVAEEPSANTSKDDETSAINKESLNSEVDEKGELYGAKATLSWTIEGSRFKVSWSLPEGTTSTADYVALYCTGE